MEQLVASVADLSLWQLLHLLITIARELQGRVAGMPGGNGFLPHEDPEGGYDGPNRQDMRGRAFQRPAPLGCLNNCCICDQRCIRLEPGHKDCKCRRHLHCR